VSLCFCVSVCCVSVWCGCVCVCMCVLGGQVAKIPAALLSRVCVCKCVLCVCVYVCLLGGQGVEIPADVGVRAVSWGGKRYPYGQVLFLQFFFPLVSKPLAEEENTVRMARYNF
jgi:hypothetical protein